MTKPKLFDPQKTLEEARSRFVNYYLEVTRRGQFDFDALDMEWGNIQSGMQICLEQQNLIHFAQFFDALRSYMVERTRENEFLAYARLILEGDQLQGEQETILSQMAKIEEDRGNYEEARKIYREQLVRVTNIVQDKNKGVPYQILSEIARLAILQADYGDAKQVLEDKLDIAQKRGNSKEQVNALYELGKLHVKIGNLDLSG